MEEAPIHQAVTDARNRSIQEGRNREREDIIAWVQKHKTKTIKIEELVKALKERQ